MEKGAEYVDLWKEAESDCFIRKREKKRVRD
jgi:hypothetical protein